MTSEAEPEPIAVQREKGNRRFSDWLAGPNLHHLLDERDSRAEPLVQLAGARTSLRCKAVTITFLPPAVAALHAFKAKSRSFENRRRRLSKLDLCTTNSWSSIMTRGIVS